MVIHSVCVDKVMKKVLHEENSRTALFGQDSVRKKPKKYLQYVAALLATLSAFSMGQCISWTSPALPMLQRNDSHIIITDEEGSWIGSLLTLGALVGAMPAGALTDKFGAKTVLQLLALPVMSSWIILAFSQAIWYLYLARILSGLAIGAISVAAPTYVAEVADSGNRGTLGTFFQLQVTIGLLFQFVLGVLVNDFMFFNLISAIIPLMFLISFSFMPDSPVHLASQGNLNQAKANLVRLRGGAHSIEKELDELRKSATVNGKQKANFSDLVKCRASSRALVISLGLMIFQQLSGVNAVLFYAKIIFSSMEVALNPDQCTVIIGLSQVIATYFSSMLIDRLGRRILLLISSSVMGFCLIILATYFQIPWLRNYSFLPLLSICIFILVFSIGFGPIPWLMIGELFSPNVKGLASSISVSANWMLAFAVTKLFQDMQHYLGPFFTFSLFGVLCICGTIFVIFLVPETKGKELYEIQQILKGTKELNGDEENVSFDENVKCTVFRRHSTREESQQ